MMGHMDISERLRRALTVRWVGSTLLLGIAVAVFAVWAIGPLGIVLGLAAWVLTWLVGVVDPEDGDGS